MKAGIENRALDSGVICSTIDVETWIELEGQVNPGFVPDGMSLEEFTDTALAEVNASRDDFAERLYENLHDNDELWGGIMEVADDVIRDFIEELIFAIEKGLV